MIKQFMKMGGVKTEKEFYAKYPTEESFFAAHPEARQYQAGGAQMPDKETIVKYLQAFAEMQGMNVEELVQQLQQLPQEKQAEALQQIIQTVEQSGGSSQGQADLGAFVYGGSKEIAFPTAEPYKNFFEYGAKTANIPMIAQQGDEVGAPYRPVSVPMEQAPAYQAASVDEPEPKSFGEAFKKNRSLGVDKFQWRGKWYTTQTKEEAARSKAPARVVSAPQMSAPAAIPMVGVPAAYYEEPVIYEKPGTRDTPKALPNKTQAKQAVRKSRVDEIYFGIPTGRPARRSDYVNEPVPQFDANAMAPMPSTFYPEYMKQQAALQAYTKSLPAYSYYDMMDVDPYMRQYKRMDNKGRVYQTGGEESSGPEWLIPAVGAAGATAGTAVGQYVLRNIDAKPISPQGRAVTPINLSNDQLSAYSEITNELFESEFEKLRKKGIKNPTVNDVPKAVHDAIMDDANMLFQMSPKDRANALFLRKKIFKPEVPFAQAMEEWMAKSGIRRTAAVLGRNIKSPVPAGAGKMLRRAAIPALAGYLTYKWLSPDEGEAAGYDPSYAPVDSTEGINQFIEYEAQQYGGTTSPGINNTQAQLSQNANNFLQFLRDNVDINNYGVEVKRNGGVPKKKVGMAQTGMQVDKFSLLQRTPYEEDMSDMGDYGAYPALGMDWERREMTADELFHGANDGKSRWSGWNNLPGIYKAEALLSLSGGINRARESHLEKKRQDQLDTEMQAMRFATAQPVNRGKYLTNNMGFVPPTMQTPVQFSGYNPGVYGKYGTEVMYLTDDQINDILRQGGEIEFLD